MTDQPFIMLSERLAQGPMSAAEAQQYAAGLADALRRLHDQGSVAGGLEPSRIMLSGPTVKLVAGEPSGAVTPYTSPEQLQGLAPDARSDIFAYGAIVHEMVSGRKAFAGATPEEIRTAILEREPAPLPAGHAEFAKVTAKCLAKGPLQRWQRMQRVQMELKLLTVVARRAGQDTAAKAADRMHELVRSQIGEMEARLSARIEVQDTKLRAAAGTELALRAEIAALEARLASRADTHDTRTTASLSETEHALLTEIAALEARLGGRLDAHDARLAPVDQTLRTHGSSIESLESAISQTDDLVERVVEALDSLERSFAEQHEFKVVAGRN